MIVLFRAFRQLWTEYAEFQTLCRVIAMLGIALIFLDLKYKPQAADLLVEAHGTLLDLVVVGVIGAVFLHWRTVPPSSAAYAQLLSAVEDLVDSFSGETGPTLWAYRFGNHWVLSRAYRPDQALPTGHPVWLARSLRSTASERSEQLERLLSSPPAQRDPELAALILSLIEALSYTRSYETLDNFVPKSDTVGKRVVRIAHEIAVRVAARSDEDTSNGLLKKRWNEHLRARERSPGGHVGA